MDTIEKCVAIDCDSKHDWGTPKKEKKGLAMLEKENTKTHPALDLRENAVSVPLVHLFFLVIYKSIWLFINGKLWDEWKTAQRRRAMKFMKFKQIF